jgi:glycosyltransferase involved in cell wall biosynthesis
LLLLIFSRYSSSQASTRARFFQYLPALRSAGLDVEVFSILDDEAIAGRSSRLTLVLSRLKSFGRVAKRLLRERNRPSHVHIYIELLPWLPFFVERLLLAIAARRLYSIELDDAWFHRYDNHRSAFIRAVLGTKIDRLMQQAKIVIAGNNYIAQRAKAAGASWVEVIPSVVDIERYRPGSNGGLAGGEILSIPAGSQPPAHANPQGKLPAIGWIGSPATTSMLLHIRNVIWKIHDAGLATFIAIGADASKLAALPVRCIPWSEDSEVAALHRLDIGVMPLTDTLFDRGKSGYKIIQYMACGLPVVASPVGTNSSIVLHGQTGFLASTDEEWFAYLSKLCADQSLRAQFGKDGLARAESCYSLQLGAAKVVSIFRKLSDRPGIDVDAEVQRHSRSY